MAIRIRRGGGKFTRIDPSMAEKAIDTARKALQYSSIGPILVHRGPRGEVHVDIPLVYNGVALDRIHYDPVLDCFSPKGRPVHAAVEKIDLDRIREKAEEMMRESRVIDAAEYREPEKCWAVPVAWKTFIIAHIRVDVHGEELVPDYGLTAEIGGRILG